MCLNSESRELCTYLFSPIMILLARKIDSLNSCLDKTRHTFFGQTQWMANWWFVYYSLGNNRKLDLPFYANYLRWRQFALSVKPYFLEKNKKKVFQESSAEIFTQPAKHWRTNQTCGLMVPVRSKSTLWHKWQIMGKGIFEMLATAMIRIKLYIHENWSASWQLLWWCWPAFMNVQLDSDHCCQYILYIWQDDADQPSWMYSLILIIAVSIFCTFSRMMLTSLHGCTAWFWIYSIFFTFMKAGQHHHCVSVYSAVFSSFVSKQWSYDQTGCEFHLQLNFLTLQLITFYGSMILPYLCSISLFFFQVYKNPYYYGLKKNWQVFLGLTNGR